MKYKIETKIYDIKIAEDTTEAISRPEHIFEMLKGDFNPVQEEMYILIFNIKNKLVEKILLAKGSKNSLMITPAEIFRTVLLTSGCNFILAHNHPSCDVTPSEEDIIFTKKVIKASEIMGISMLDHIIYSDKEYMSFKKENLI